MKKLLVVLMVLVFAAPAMAADWNFYGSARMATFFTNEDVGDLEDLPAGATSTSVEDSNFAHGLQGNARIGANVKVSDEIGGGFEYGSGPNLRKLFGTYTFGGSQLLVGQTYTPTSTYFYSNSVFDGDGDLLGLGQFYHGRRPMIQLKSGGFKVALVDPAVGVSALEGAVNDFDDVDNTLPKIEVAYNMKSDGFFVDVFAGYLGYTLEDNANDEDITISSYTVGIGGGLMLGPANIKLAVNTGQNYGAYGAYQGFTGRSIETTAGDLDLGMVDEPTLNADGDDVEDTTAIQGLLVINFKASDMLTVEGGIGYASYANDDFEEDYVKTQYYINATINIAPGFFIVPEVGMINYGDDPLLEEDLGSTTYYGVKTQINF